MGFLHRVEKWTNAALLLFCLGVTMLIGAIRFLTGPEFALSLFYLFPITLAAWKMGLKAGLLVSLCATFTWLLADVAMIDAFSQAFVPYVNESFRLIVFIIITKVICELKRALDIQKTLALTDPLTGMHNRRSFFESARIELCKAKRYGQSLSLLSIDLDNFKTVNDEYGHPVGDKLLACVARTLKSNIRVIDIAARFGGDEFCILFPQIGPHAASRIADKLNSMLLKVMIQNHWPVTFSIGLVAYHIVPESQTIHDIVGIADTLMYDAKKGGKNMIATTFK